MTDAAALVDLVLDDVVAAIRLGRPVLQHAALQGHEDVLRFLLQRISSSTNRPPSPDQPELSKALSAALLGAAQQGHPHCISALLESTASSSRRRNISIERLVTARNELGETALILAAKSGRADCVKILLQHSPIPQVAAADERGNTALIEAAYGGHAECVRELLQLTPQAQVAAADKIGGTALTFALEDGHTECVKQLLQHSPEAQMASRGGAFALVAAAWSNHPGCMALLLAHSTSSQVAAVDIGGESLLEVSARFGHPQCLDLLLAHDPQPQHLDAAWLSALRQWDATQPRTSPHTQCLERLIAKGALLPSSAEEADKAKGRLFIQEVGSRALVPERANEAMVGLAMSVRGRKRKAGQGEEEA